MRFFIWGLSIQAGGWEIVLAFRILAVRLLSAFLKLKNLLLPSSAVKKLQEEFPGQEGVCHLMEHDRQEGNEQACCFGENQQASPGARCSS